LLDRLALAENHLGESLPQRPVVVHPGKPQVLVWEVPELRRGGLRRGLAHPNLLQQLEEYFSIHGFFRCRTERRKARWRRRGQQTTTKTAAGQWLSVCLSIVTDFKSDKVCLA
jgi:hypothetical protein